MCMLERDVESRWAVDFILMLSKMDRMILRLSRYGA